MLPTNEKANEDKLIFRENRLMFQTKKEAKNDRKWSISKHFHLYILSDEKIKEGDWYIHNQSPNGLRVWQHKGIHLPMDSEKIIATTDLNIAIKKGNRFLITRI